MILQSGSVFTGQLVGQEADVNNLVVTFNSHCSDVLDEIAPLKSPLVTTAKPTLETHT